MKTLVDAYLQAHQDSWAPSTLKSEASRLYAIQDHLNRTPEGLYKYLQSLGQKPYTIKTTFIRIVALEKWGKLQPRFQEYMEKHGRRFKHIYQKEELEVTYEQALERVKTLSDPSRGMAEALLATGCRLSEAYTFRDNRVTGKGGRVRKVYGKIKETAAKSTFARKLKAVGLKAHTLRKLCATRLAEKGASPADLCKVFGWTSIGTAYQYLQPAEDARLEALMAACKTKR